MYEIYDIHCHILPGIDDGSASADETLEMTKIAVSSGVRAIICTPHSEPQVDYPVILIDKLIKAYFRFFEKRNMQMLFLPGQEIMLTDDAVAGLRNGQLLTLNRTAYALVEFDPSESADNAFRRLGELRSIGIIPVVAHPERYGFICGDVQNIGRLKSLGCLLQVNKGSLKGAFGPSAAEAARCIFENRSADFVASDAHSPYVRTNALDETHEYISEHYSADYADFLLRDNPLRVIRNQRIYEY